MRTKSCIANSDGRGIASLYFAMADFIKVKSGLDAGNAELLHSCAGNLGCVSIDIDDAVMVILKELKAFLEKSHVLRIIK